MASGHAFWLDTDAKIIAMTPTPGPANFVSMAVDHQNRLYFQPHDAFGSLWRYTPNSPVDTLKISDAHNNGQPSIPFTECYAFALDRLDRLWLATDQGLAQWKNGVWKTFFPPGPVLPHFERMAGGGDGVWLYSTGSGQPLVQFFDGQDTLPAQPVPIDILAGQEIFGMQTDSRNWLWMVVKGGQAMCFNGNDLVISDGSTLKQPNITNASLAEDGQGNMVFSNGAMALRLALPTATITGRFVEDLDDDCAAQPGEPSASGFAVIFDDGKSRSTVVADPDGQFTARLPLGSYTAIVRATTPFGQPCAASFSVDMPTVGDSVHLEVPVKIGVKSPLLSVSLGSTTPVRRCASTVFWASVCNNGNLAATASAVTVELPVGLETTGASLPFAPVGGGKYRFSIGEVAADDCVRFSFTVRAGCPGGIAIGQSVCVTAHVEPDTIPTVGSFSWTNGTVVAKGSCEGDKVRFTATNSSAQPVGPLDYAILRDAYLFETGSQSFSANEARDFYLDADGSTWRFSIEQVAGHPLAPAPSVAVEGCPLAGSMRSLGFVEQAGNATGSPFDYTDCQTVVGSFDPNDKSARPTGWGTRHDVAPGQWLRYDIRFQNTGTDTAFRVEVRDTLDPRLDWATARPEVSSHAFMLKKDSASRALSFVFENIRLPDSTRDEAGSHGFVRFSVRVRPNAPLGSRLENRAAIYFDINSPVLTGTVWHTVDTGFVQKKPERPSGLSLLKVVPNPVRARRKSSSTGLSLARRMSFGCSTRPVGWCAAR